MAPRTWRNLAPAWPNIRFYESSSETFLITAHMSCKYMYLILIKSNLRILFTHCDAYYINLNRIIHDRFRIFNGHRSHNLDQWPTRACSKANSSCWALSWHHGNSRVNQPKTRELRLAKQQKAIGRCCWWLLMEKCLYWYSMSRNIVSMENAFIDTMLADTMGIDTCIYTTSAICQLRLWSDSYCNQTLGYIFRLYQKITNIDRFRIIFCKVAPVLQFYSSTWFQLTHIVQIAGPFPANMMDHHPSQSTLTLPP